MVNVGGTPWNACDELDLGVGIAGNVGKGEDVSRVLRGCVSGETVTLFLIADGHSGDMASKHVAEHLLPAILEAAADASTAGLQAACASSFESCNTAILSDSVISMSGCSCTVILINHKRCQATFAWVGDCMVMLTLPTMADMVTTSHRFEHNESERERVKAMGAQVGRAINRSTGKSTGPLRAWPGGLTVGRVLGDVDCGSWALGQPEFASRQLPVSWVDPATHRFPLPMPTPAPPPKTVAA